MLGLALMGLLDMLLFGIVPGALLFLAQIAWIPFWAAGVINGIGPLVAFSRRLRSYA